MAITYNEQTRVFSVETEHTGYYIGIVDDEGFVAHIHYGKRLTGDDELPQLLRLRESPLAPSQNERDRCAFYDTLPWEYPCGGTGDFRESCLNVLNARGQSGAQLRFERYELINGKPALAGLPATFAANVTDCQTLLLHCIDCEISLRVTLRYSVFAGVDAVLRSAELHNCGTEPLTVTKAYSVCLDMDDRGFDFISLQGAWGRERHIERTPLHHGKTSISSLRGETSLQANNFFALAARSADYDAGEVYGFSLIYSGNFLSQAEMTQFNAVRAVTGIHSEGFSWRLLPGESFAVPEAALVYSAQGLGKMQRTFHDLWRGHLLRGAWKDRERPVLINNWEATYFDFTTEKLLAIAEKAAASGIELLVMDDGWFGKRNRDDSSLGDWVVNEEKLAGGLARLANGVGALGMKLGLWFEPEMVSPDSDLYRAHRDWAIAVSGRTPTQSRAQYVLDLSRADVRDYVFNAVSAVLRSAAIAYVKWDMNRALTDVGSAVLPPERAGELHHRYVLGVYELQERLLTAFPDLLLENCSSGGGRFDPAMLYYSPQIWCSDDTDAIERLAIQEGTALVYPPATMGAHVAACPNHACGRSTPFMTRAFVALAGTFGYELDITTLSPDEAAQIPHQVALYKRYNALVRTGDYYRVASFAQNHEWDAWLIAAKDRSCVLLTVVQVLNHPNYRSRKIPLPVGALSDDARYRVTRETSDGTADDLGEWSATTLCNAGFLLPRQWGDFQSALVLFERM